MPKLQTPWGPAETVIRLDPDDMIMCVQTATHGGIGVHPHQAVPAHITTCAEVDQDGWRWFEEDIAAAAVIVAFPHLFGPGSLDAAKDALRNTLPEIYTAHFAEALTAANSRALERREFEAATRDKFVVTAGFGSSCWNVPVGYVYACGFRQCDEATAGFLVPQAKYIKPGRLILDEFPNWEPDRTLPYQKIQRESAETQAI